MTTPEQFRITGAGEYRTQSGERIAIDRQWSDGAWSGKGDGAAPDEFEFWETDGAYSVVANEGRRIVAPWPAPTPSPAPAGGEGSALIERIQQRISVFRWTEPESGETWESWYCAAFDLLAAEIAALTPAPAGWRAPEGWQLVPKEPTQAMLDALDSAFEDPTDKANCWLRNGYAAMLTAAPLPSQQEGA